MVKRFGHFLVWSFLFILILLAVDLSLIHIPSQSNGFNQIRNVYLDFRSRFFGLLTGNPTTNVDEILQQRLFERGFSQEPADDKGPRFFYVDKNGDIHFVADMKEIPPGYRSTAKKLDR